jgi:hypothetical protein
MGILKNYMKSLLGLKGVKPNSMESALSTSKKHFTTSLNGQPGPLKSGQVPSLLDLDAKQPEKYLDNPPL